MLHKLTLFKNVKITPDYSVVHDLTPSDWKDYLVGTPLDPVANGEIVWEGMVNYYRLPDVIRIEGNYDTLRKVTYGMVDCSRGTDETQLVINESMERPMFFFVKNVRLIKQESRVDKDEVSTPMVWEVKDVVELEIEVDVWSSNNGSFELYDSYVERRHMPRWKNTGTELSPVWEPIYYPNAGQGVEGAYELEDSKDITLSQYTGGKHVDPRYIIVFAIKTSGEACLFIGMDAYVQEDDAFQPVYRNHAQNQVYFGLEDILDGSFYGAAGANITADLVQSIVVVPSLRQLQFAMKIPSGQTYIEIDETAVQFSGFTSHSGSSGLSWLDVDFDIGDMRSLMAKSMTGFGAIIAPDHDAVPVDGEYLDQHEPQMYYTPARMRKVVTSFGGELFTIPDIKAFDKTISHDNIFDMTGAVTYVYSGSDLKTANAVGALGVMEAATLPIHNSAWKSYEAINKIGDEIAYNAKQMQTIANGAAGTASNAIVGGAIGGVLGGAANIITGIVGTGTAMYGNAEELRAKQTVIKNSPCNVKSTGSGLTAAVEGLVTMDYVTLKMDEQSTEKLRQMYYWFGYHVNRMIKGSISLHTRSKFDYIKTNGAKIKGMIPSSAAKQLSEIFDRGVSVFHSYDSIGDSTLYENDEV